MRQELDVDWGILTNGKSFEVLNKNRNRNSGEEVAVVQFDLDALSENPGVLKLLTKESIRSGKSDEIAEQVAQTNQAIHYLKENADSVANSVTEAVERETGELTIDLKEQSREFVQNLVSVLRDQRQFVNETTSAESAKSRQSSNEQGMGIKAAKTNTTSTLGNHQGYVIRVSDGKLIPEDGARRMTQQKQNMGAVVDYLIKEYDLIDELAIPHSPLQARKNCSINSEPNHPNGEGMRSPYELVNGYYLHTSLNTRGKKARLRDLAEQVGLSVEFLGEWQSDGRNQAFHR